MKEIILTEKEIASIQSFCNKAKKIRQEKTGIVEDFYNIVIKQEPDNIGDQLFIQTQEDFWNKLDNWEDITDYEAW